MKSGNLFNDDPFAASDTADLLVAAGHQLRDADRLMAKLEEEQKLTLNLLRRTVDLVEELEIKLNAWRFKAEEMEKDRNVWQARAEALETQYRAAARRAAELGALTGEARCPECGSKEFSLTCGGYSGPVGEDDTRWEEGVFLCGECGHREEAKP